MAEYKIQGATLTAIADAIRNKTGSSSLIATENMANEISNISTGVDLPKLTNEGTADDLLFGKELIDGDGNIITGTIENNTSSDVTVNRETVTIPAGYYATQVSKAVATVEQATPKIEVDSAGLITATTNQSEGYVSGGNKSSTKQLATQSAKTIIPGVSNQTAVTGGKYTTGDIIVSGDANLVAKNIKKGISIFGVNGTMSETVTVESTARQLLERTTLLEIRDDTITVLGNQALQHCTSLVSAYFPAVTTIKLATLQNCYALTSAYFPNLATVGSNAFQNCRELIEITLPKASSVSLQCFQGCTKLVYADFPCAKSIGEQAFKACPALETLILRSVSLIPLIHTTVLADSGISNGSGYVYVPSALVESYKAATNWSTYASQIRAIEDYPDITGG